MYCISVSDDLCQNELSSCLIKQITKKIALIHVGGCYFEIFIFNFQPGKLFLRPFHIKRSPISFTDSEKTSKNEKGLEIGLFLRVQSRIRLSSDQVPTYWQVSQEKRVMPRKERAGHSNKTQYAIKAIMSYKMNFLKKF